MPIEYPYNQTELDKFHSIGLERANTPDLVVVFANAVSESSRSELMKALSAEIVDIKVGKLDTIYTARSSTNPYTGVKTNVAILSLSDMGLYQGFPVQCAISNIFGHVNVGDSIPPVPAKMAVILMPKEESCPKP